MPKLTWTKGFCKNPSCGRYIGHFDQNVSCPQCDGKSPPTYATNCLNTFGIDYAIGWLLGVLTCAKWSTSRIAERLFWHTICVRPRLSEEITVILLFCISLGISLCAWWFHISINSPVGILLAAILLYRILEIVAIRLRIILYDQRQSEWRHASYARSILLLTINIGEIVFIFSYLYASTFSMNGYHFPFFSDAVAYSLAGFFSLTPEYLSSLPKLRVIDFIRLFELVTVSSLLVTGFAALVNMMGIGKEVHTRR